MKKAHFTDCADAVASFLSEAKQSLHVAVCWFTSPDLYRILDDRIKAGVTVSLILNFDQVNFQPQGLDFLGLEKAGARVCGFTGPELLHHKFAIADEKRVLCGSYNWTRAEHRDHVLITEEPVVAGEFMDAFRMLWAHSQSLDSLRNTPPRSLFFQHLHQPVWWSASDVRKRIISGAKVWTLAFPEKPANLWEQCLRQQSHTFYCKGMLGAYWEHNRLWDAAAFRVWMEENAHLRGIKPAAAYCLRLRLGDVVVAVTRPGKVLGIGIVGSDPEPCPHSPGDVMRYVPWLAVPDHFSFSDLVPAGNGRGLRRYPGSGLRLVETIRAAMEG